MVGKIDLHKLNMEELNGVVSMYPWYTAARLELCRRMAGMGALSQSEAVQTALYCCSRQTVAKLLEEGERPNYTDKTAPVAPENSAQVREIFVVGGDYFSRDQYEKAGKEDDNIFSRFASKAREDGYEGKEESVSPEDFYTETLAKIYLEQDYPEEAVEIYSKLSLRYPEKSVYFAALIDEIKKNHN